MGLDMWVGVRPHAIVCPELEQNDDALLSQKPDVTHLNSRHIKV